ncbi:hypothetical protein [Penaeicola halotolerans]|uniref:hypothetical protein n=1 Tax=Penaeicola halotolerans TaxID=2793196 RepID=UPI001CF8329E|nr:hypothetical protein [Penaeicola halotolerans]
MKIKSIVLLLFFISVIVLTIFYSKKAIEYERNLEINFKVSRVEITPALRAVLYDKNNNKLDLQRVVFYRSHDVKAGDIVLKKAGSDVLRVYREDSLGLKKIVLTLKID